MPGEHRVEGLELQVAPDLGPHELHAPDLDLGPGRLGQRAPGPAGAICSGFSPPWGSRIRYSWASPNCWMTALAQLDLVEAPPDVARPSTGLS